ncbi:hypothetical protein [Eubacterium ramulus]
MKNSREENSEIVEKIKSELENQETLKSHDITVIPGEMSNGDAK